VGLYFAVIHKATISRFTVTKTILMTFASLFISEQCMEESKTSRLHCGLLAIHSLGLPRSYAALCAVFNTAVSHIQDVTGGMCHT
jgi:hypothetical protein